MWNYSWFDDLYFDNESLFASNGQQMPHNTANEKNKSYAKTAKHIIKRQSNCHTRSIAAKDG